MQNLLKLILITLCFLLLCVSVSAQEELGRSYYDLGIFAYEDKDYDAAVENFKKALSFSPKNPYYNHYLGKTYLDMAQYDEAGKYLERAWEADPAIEGLKYDYAFLSFKMSDFEKSAALFLEIVSL